MAVISSHILNGADGSHAGGVKVRLRNLATGQTEFEAETDPGGRISIELKYPDPAAEYEFSLNAGAYWSARGVPTRLTEIALRFRMPHPDQSYHSPVILSPNGYSGWVSA